MHVGSAGHTKPTRRMCKILTFSMDNPLLRMKNPNTADLLIAITGKASAPASV